MPSLDGTACCGSSTGHHAHRNPSLCRHRLKTNGRTVPGGATFPRLLLHPWRHGSKWKSPLSPAWSETSRRGPLWEVAWRPSQSMELRQG
jgi:hypothetical protein